MAKDIASLCAINRRKLNSFCLEQVLISLHVLGRGSHVVHEFISLAARRRSRWASWSWAGFDGPALRTLQRVSHVESLLHSEVWTSASVVA